MARKKKHGKERSRSQSDLKTSEPQYPFWIFETIAGALLIIGYMLTLSPLHKKLALFVFFAAYVFAGLGVVIKLYREFSEPPTNKLDKEVSSQLTEPKPASASPAVSRVTAPPSLPPLPTEMPKVTGTPTATPSTASIVTPTPIAPATPTPTPEPTSDALYVSNDPNEVARKLQEAKNQGTSKHVRKALVNVRVDWKLLYWDARYTDDNTKVDVFFIWKSSADALKPTDLAVSFELPMEGHERLPLRDKYFEFRTEGVIEEVSAIGIVHLKEVRITPNQ